MQRASYYRLLWRPKLPTFRKRPTPPPQAPVAYIPAAPPVYNWGGIYVGINGGWGLGNGKWTVSGNGASSDKANGGIVGGTLGCNYQTSAFVFGVEGDFDWSGINSSTANNVCIFSGNCQTGNNWLSTLRGRAGCAVDRVLFYGTAGGVFGNVQTTFNAASLPPIPKPVGPLASASKPLLPRTGRRRSSISMSILAPEARPARRKAVWA